MRPKLAPQWFSPSVREGRVTVSVSGRRKEKRKTTTKGAHQVKRHKDGMQELWGIGLRDERLQTGLKKQASETHLRPFVNRLANIRLNSPEGKGNI